MQRPGRSTSETTRGLGWFATLGNAGGAPCARVGAVEVITRMKIKDSLIVCQCVCKQREIALREGNPRLTSSRRCSRAFDHTGLSRNHIVRFKARWFWDVLHTQPSLETQNEMNLCDVMSYCLLLIALRSTKINIHSRNHLAQHSTINGDGRLAVPFGTSCTGCFTAAGRTHNK